MPASVSRLETHLRLVQEAPSLPCLGPHPLTATPPQLRTAASREGRRQCKENSVHGAGGRGPSCASLADTLAQAALREDRRARSGGAPHQHTMEGFYTLLFALLSIVCLLLEWPRAGAGGTAASKAGTAPLPASFTAFRNNYLVVYSLMMGACLPNPRSSAGTWGTARCVSARVPKKLGPRLYLPLCFSLPPHPPLCCCLQPQPATGSRAPMCMPCMPATGSARGTLASCSSQALAPPWSSAPSSAHWQTNSASVAHPAVWVAVSHAGRDTSAGNSP
jgi:hypothetical protein